MMKSHLTRSRQIRLLALLLAAVGILYALNTPWGRKLISIPAVSPKKTPAVKAAPKTTVEPKYKVELLKWFEFSDKEALRDWEEKVFKGRVSYLVENENALSYVKAESQAAASALYYKIKLDPDMNPVISWRWKVDKFPVKTKPENLELQEEHDFAARVYVIFPAMFILNSKVLEYIWANELPVGTSGTSPYSHNIRLVVLESGQAGPDEWKFEERDIRADYIKAFGRQPDKDVGAIAFMTNAEHTGSVADARYDDIKVGYLEEKRGEGK